MRRREAVDKDGVVVGQQRRAMYTRVEAVGKDGAVVGSREGHVQGWVTGRLWIGLGQWSEARRVVGGGEWGESWEAGEGHVWSLVVLLYLSCGKRVASPPLACPASCFSYLPTC